VLLRRALAIGVATSIAVAIVLAAWHSPPPIPPVLDEQALVADVPMLAAADTPRSIDDLRARIAAVLAREGIPGAAIALVGKAGPIWVGGVGVADLETQRLVDGDTMFRVGSLTKVFVALGVMKLVDEHRLSIDDPLRLQVPDAGVTNPWEATSPVTLAQVMEHTAGLDDMRFNEMFTDDDALPVARALAINPRSRIVRWRPGTRMAYSNVGFTLAGRAIEVATGEPFDPWLRREILEPLGIRDADFRLTPALAARLASGYIEHDTPSPYRPIAHRPSGALLISANDLARLVQFFLRRGEGFPGVVSATSLARIEFTGTLPYPPTAANYGLANYGDVGHPVFGRGHDGALPGYLATLRYFPKLGTGYVILMNGTFSWRAMVQLRALVFSYLAARNRPPGEVDSVLAPITDAPRADYFAFGSPRHELFAFLDRALTGWHVVAMPGGLHIDSLTGDDGWEDLVVAPDGGYRVPGHSGSSMRFTETADGTPVMITPYLYAEAGSWWWARVRVALLWLAWCLLELAPVWLAGVVAVSASSGRRLPLRFAVWPALAAGSLFALPHMFYAAAQHGVLGEVCAWTLGIFVGSIAFAAASVAGLVSVFRAALRPDRPSPWLLVVPAACSLAACAMTVWLGANGIIGLRTWAW
jgi:CubicO group peptidase (beta-lactamase class C family)